MQVTLRHSILLLALAGSEAMAADVPEGKRLYDQHCAECHAPGAGRPGTQQLGWTRGNDRAVLEKRRDLAVDYISFVVRNGLLEMPPFRPTEIDDAGLRQLAEYLAAPAKKSRKAR
jgi:mono/diheme cytochrome c family protein